jgi:hypothetical protein
MKNKLPSYLWVSALLVLGTQAAYAQTTAAQRVAGAQPQAAPAPQAMNYQGIARDLLGRPLQNKAIALRLSVLAGGADAPAVYTETHRVVTSAQGAFALAVGRGSAAQGTFAGLKWGSTNHFLRVEIDPAGGSNFRVMGTSELLSVPYALYAGMAGQLSAGAGATAGPTNSAQGGNSPGVPSQVWSLFGNSGVNPLTDRLGTTDEADLVLITNNIDRLVITSQGDVLIRKNLGVGNNLTVGNDLTVSKNVNLNTAGGATINYGPLTVANTSPTTLTGTLTVTGATNLNSTLNTLGATTLRSTLGVTGATDLGSTLNTVGATTLRNTLDVTGATNLGSTLNTVGATTLRNTLGVTGATSLGSTLGVTGATTLNNTLGVTGATTLGNTLGVTGATTLNSTLNTLGATTLRNTLDVTGATTLNSTLNVLGATVMRSTLGIDGALNLGSTLGVAGATTLNNTLAVAGATNLASALTVQGASLMRSTLGVSGATTLGSTLGVTGAASLSNTLGVGGATTLGNTLAVAGATTLNNTLAANGQVTITANVGGGDASYGAYPLRVQGSDQGLAIKLNAGTPNNANNFVTFFNSSGNAVGRIEGETEPEVANDPEFIYNEAIAVAEVAKDGANVVLAAIPVVVGGLGVSAGPCGACLAMAAADLVLSTANLVSYNAFAFSNLGVTYQSGSADYAEWLERSNAAEKLTPGDIVAVNAGKITKYTTSGQQFMVISTKPAVLGNMPPTGSEAAYEKVAFMGQIPVKVRGLVLAGDYILPSGRNDGFGVGVSPKDIKPEQYKQIVGVAWSESLVEGISSTVNMAIGLNSNDLANLAVEQDKKIKALEGKYASLEARLLALEGGPAPKPATPVLATAAPAPAKELTRYELLKQNMPAELSNDVMANAISDLKATYAKQGLSYKNNPGLTRLFTDMAFQAEVIRKAQATYKASYQTILERSRQ